MNTTISDLSFDVGSVITSEQAAEIIALLEEIKQYQFHIDEVLVWIYSLLLLIIVVRVIAKIFHGLGY